jgi:histidinol phosphatase-like PHP family hydrolase
VSADRTPFDHHVHAELSGDSTVPLEERARTAHGPRPHGISEHYPSTHLHDDDDVLRYVERAKRLGLAVALEYDIGIAPPLRPSTRDALDYLVAALHQVEIGGRLISYDAAGDFLKSRTRAYADAALFADGALGPRVLEAILAAVGASFERDRVDILGHPTFSPLLALGDPEAAYPREWQERLIELCVRAGVALEINETYRVPHRAFVQRAAAAGARFSVGSDSHAELLPLRYTLELVRMSGVARRLRGQAAGSRSSATSS